MHPNVLLLHFVSWRKHIWGFSIFIMFFRIWSFPGLLSPLKFHEVSFIIHYWWKVYSTSSILHTCLNPPGFSLLHLFTGDPFSSPSFWSLLEGGFHPNNCLVGCLAISANKPLIGLLPICWVAALGFCHSLSFYKLAQAGECLVLPYQNFLGLHPSAAPDYLLQ